MSYNDRVRVSITQQRDAYARTNGICVICGQRLTKDESKWSVDHFIPRAIYKWVGNKEIKDLIEGSRNIFVVHEQCNFGKDSTLPTNQVIKSMYASDSIKVEMRELYKEVEDSVINYRAMKQSTLDGQSKRCAGCGKALALSDATMRRINNHEKRSRENAMCLCENCNIRASYKGQKSKILKKAKSENIIKI